MSACREENINEVCDIICANITTNRDVVFYHIDNFHIINTESCRHLLGLDCDTHNKRYNLSLTTRDNLTSATLRIVKLRTADTGTWNCKSENGLSNNVTVRPIGKILKNIVIRLFYVCVPC